MNIKAISRLRNGQITKAGHVAGFYARRRAGRTVWLVRYPGPNKVQRELIFGCVSEDGYMGQLASAVAHEAIGRKVDFEAALLASKGAREPIPPQHAELVARKLRTMIESGRDLVAELKQKRTEAAVEEAERKDRTLEAVGGQWIAHLRRKGRKSADEVERTLKRHVYSELGAWSIERVTYPRVIKIVDALTDQGKAATASLVFRLMRALLSFAARRRIITVNPLMRMGTDDLPDLKPRDRVLIAYHPNRPPDASELRAIWLAADQLTTPQREFVQVLVLTAQRLKEVGQMTWGELDDGLWRLPAERHKGRRGFELPLPSQALAILDSLAEPTARRPHAFVFKGRGGRPIGDYSKIKSDLDRLSGVTGWRFHDVRRTASDWLLKAGFPPSDVHGVLGHAPDRLTATYMQGVGFERMRIALQSWANFVGGGADRKVVPIRA